MRIQKTAARLKARPLAIVAGLALVSTNLRPAITTVAGVMEQLGDQFALDPQLLPLLGAVPVLAFGISAPCGPWLARRLGAGKAVSAALLVLALALLARVLVPEMLLVGTFLAGASIMTASVLVPQIVKANKGTGWWTGICTMCFGLGAALGAGLIQPLQHAFGGNLKTALAVWAIPALLGAWLISRTDGTTHRPDRTAAARQTATKPQDGSRPLRNQRTAWSVTAFFGLQALLYFAVTSWLAVFLISNGWSAVDAAGLLAWFSLAGLPASLLTPVLAGRPRILNVLAPGLGVLIAAGLIGVLTAPPDLQFVVVGVLGIVQSAAFSLGIALVVIRSDGPRSAGRLSAMSQGLGFAFASVGPFFTGLLHQWSDTWLFPFSFLAAVAVMLAVAGLFAVRGREVSLGSDEPDDVLESEAMAPAVSYSGDEALPRA